jgi:hypothetical protein
MSLMHLICGSMSLSALTPALALDHDHWRSMVLSNS